MKVYIPSNTNLITGVANYDSKRVTPSELLDKVRSERRSLQLNNNSFDNNSNLKALNKLENELNRECPDESKVMTLLSAVSGVSSIAGLILAL